MIERYSDHAANERTFLAWVRTAIAVMAFGFLVEKFDLFLEIAARSVGARAPSMGGQLLANVAGLLLIALGGVTMVLAIVRFRATGFSGFFGSVSWARFCSGGCSSATRPTRR